MPSSRWNGSRLASQLHSHREENARKAGRATAETRIRPVGSTNSQVTLLYSMSMSRDQVILLSYDDVTPNNVMSFRGAAAERNISLCEWVPHRISVWCGDGYVQPLYENASQDPGVIIHPGIVPPWMDMPFVMVSWLKHRRSVP